MLRLECTNRDCDYEEFTDGPVPEKCPNCGDFVTARIAGPWDLLAAEMFANAAAVAQGRAE